MTGPPPAPHTLSWLRAALGDRAMPPMAVVIGIGDGAVLDAIDRLRDGVRVLVIEPDAAIASAFADTPACARRQEEGRLLCLAGPDFRGADDAWRLYPSNPDDHVVLVPPGTATSSPPVLAAARLAGKALFGARANAQARRQFAPRYLTNSLANLPAIARGSSVAALSGRFQGRPAVVVGAGPSLDDALPDLAALGARALVVATDTALRPLVHAGIEPHLVVGADPSASNARHFLALPPCPRTRLVAESALDPRAVASCAAGAFWFRVGAHEPWPWFQELGLDTAHLEMWGSVITAAFQVAVLAGCDPIVFVGADLAFTGGRPYARGTTYEFDWAHSVALGASLDEAWQRQIALTDRVTTADVHGATIETSLPLQAFRDWLVARAGTCGRRVVNATGGGIFAGPQVEQRSLRDVLHDTPALPAAAWPFVATTAVPAGVLAARVADVLSAWSTDGAATSLASRWAAFSGGVLDAAGVGAALAGAHTALRCGIAIPSGMPSLPWAALADAGLALGSLSRLPEDVAAARGSTAPVDQQRLRRALSLLAPLCRALDDPQAVTGPGAAAPDATPTSATPTSATPMAATPTFATRTCATALGAWPPAIAWPLRMIDAQLPPPAATSAPAEAGYFDAPPNPGPAAEARDPASLAGTLGATLVSRWLRAAVGAPGSTASPRARAVASALEQHVEGGDHQRRPSAQLSVTLEPAGAPAVIVSRAVDRGRWSRLLTGCLTRPAGPHAGTARLASVASAGARAVVDVAGVAGVITPRVLSEEGLARSTSAHACAGGVVVAGLHRRDSAWIGENGATRPFLSWPRSIVGQLPMGDGAVAWSNGTAAWPAREAGYVMYRATRAGPVDVEVLPFHPTAGAWFGGRLFWNTFQTGVGVWRPGDDPATLLDGVAFCGMAVVAGALVMAPCTRDGDGRVVRQRHAQGWRLAEGGTPERVDLTANGAASSHAAGAGGWTATAFPDVEVVRLGRGGCVVHLACHAPMTVAWAGRSLVVCTAPGDVLLFERLTDMLATV